jgi:hypothetical protein
LRSGGEHSAPELAVEVRRVVDDEWLLLAKSSSRVGFHDVFLCLSNVQDDGELVSEFAKSQFWIRRSVSDAPCRPVSEFVVPIEGTLSVSEDMTLSKKQWTSG